MAREGIKSWFSQLSRHLQSLGLMDSEYVLHATLSQTISRQQDCYLQDIQQKLTSFIGFSTAEGNKLRYYNLLKHKMFGMAQYLSVIKIRAYRISLTRFRTSSYNLLIEKPRYSPPLPLHERSYKICNNNVIEGEVHFLLSCPPYANI
jgi:hypothetical protein